jgi:Starch-binding associating with outer membrane
MRHTVAPCIRGTLLMLSLVGCNDFLRAKNLSHNPNAPSQAANGTLFISAQTDVYQQIEGQLGRTTCIWMQQCGGQASPFNNLNFYEYGADDYYNNWARIYGGGGLIDLRTIETTSLAVGDSNFAGQAIVLESMEIGLGADIWGDIPYSQASQAPTITQPKADPQQQVYDSLEHALSTAIVYMGATGPTNVGAQAYDNVYFAASQNTGIPQTQYWIQLAYTMKARLWVHQAEQLGTAAYDSASAAAKLGILDATGASDFVSYHTATANTANLWSDFQSIYLGDIAAGGTIVNIMNTTADPRLPAYFTSVGTSPPYVGSDTASSATLSTLSSTRSAQTFAQPIVTYVENELIIAESQCQLGHGAAATTAYQAEQAAVGATPQSPVNLSTIMTEKYVALFQNPEVWNDWKRTGLPVLQPLGGQTLIPRRLTYPLSERSANPNIPPDGLQNWNDPTATPGIPIASKC